MRVGELAKGAGAIIKKNTAHKRDTHQTCSRAAAASRGYGPAAGTQLTTVLLERHAVSRLICCKTGET